jgi:hypothetical protein
MRWQDTQFDAFVPDQGSFSTDLYRVKADCRHKGLLNLLQGSINHRTSLTVFFLDEYKPVERSDLFLAGIVGYQSTTNRSVHSECSIECLKQSRVAEWLEQTLHRTLFE